MSYVEVIGGRFHCDECGAAWVGTWHGPRELMTCRYCERPLKDEPPRAGGASSGGETR